MRPAEAVRQAVRAHGGDVMRRYLLTAAVLAVGAITVGASWFAGLVVAHEPPSRYDRWDLVSTPEQLTAWGWSVALLVLAAVPFVQHVAVVAAWAWQAARSRRRAAARVAAEALLLEGYGVGEIRIGRAPAPPVLSPP